MTFLPENTALSLSQQQALGKVSTLYQTPEIRSPSPHRPTLRFGLIADPQYADAPPDLEHNRYYRHSLRKLSAAITELNALPLDFVVTLGDLVIVFGHYPLTPINNHNLWNCETLLELLCEYQVRAYFAGHDHRGGYARIGNTDFITLKGMLDGADSLPFATVELQNGEITIHGYGTEVSRVLPAMTTD